MSATSTRAAVVDYIEMFYNSERFALDARLRLPKPVPNPAFATCGGCVIKHVSAIAEHGQ